ncbi:MAG: zinc ribbon domain-containing protein [Verrucomicrobia bacterium]|nr:zinc ribbon domain-containing protein [Verrucomicrobiota bacterium]
MPTYEYRCEKCGQTFEAFQSMKDPAYKVCPKESCRQPEWGQGPVKRLLGTGAGLIFKGSGFYITDYRSQGYKEAAKKEAGSSTGAGTSSGGSGAGTGSGGSNSGGKSGGSTGSGAPAQG